MNGINTKIFTIDELKGKKYADLVNSLADMIELVDDIENEIDTIQILEEEDGYLEPELEYELNIITTQLDYMLKNISTIKKVLNMIEMKSFFVVNNFNICLN
jgi:hypothetical protein